jgi:hypothetical protein
MDKIVSFTVIPSNVSILIFQFVIVVVNTGHVLLDTAQKLQGKVKIKNVAPNCDQKPWYDKLCKEKRNQFNMARLSYNRVKLYQYQQVGFLFYYQNIFSKSSRILSYHFLTVLSVQMHCKEKRNQFNMARLSYNRVKSGANKKYNEYKSKRIP